MKKFLMLFGLLTLFSNSHAFEVRIPKELLAIDNTDELVEPYSGKKKSSGLLPDGQKQASWWWPWGESEPEKEGFKLENIKTLEERLLKHIHGQPTAVKTTSESFIRYVAGLNNPNTPIASLLYIGPTGVGKTQLARALAFELTGSFEKMIRIDLSEYQHPVDVNRLIGAPPGYVGYYEGGQLTNWIKQNPQSIILMDEVDKAYPEVLKIFMHILDAGRITSGSGEVINCKDCIFILTTNLCAKKILELSKEGAKSEDIIAHVRPQLISRLSPEFYNRVEPIVFLGLSQETLKSIVIDMLSDVAHRVYDAKKLHVTFDETLIRYLQTEGFDPELGARPLQRLINKQIITALAYALLDNRFNAEEPISMSYDFDTETFVIKKP